MHDIVCAIHCFSRKVFLFSMIFVSYELKTLNDNECKDFYYLYTQIRYDDPSAIYCSDLKGALGCFNLGWVFFHFIFISRFQKLR